MPAGTHYHKETPSCSFTKGQKGKRPPACALMHLFIYLLITMNKELPFLSSHMWENTIFFFFTAGLAAESPPKKTKNQKKPLLNATLLRQTAGE